MIIDTAMTNNRTFQLVEEVDINQFAEICYNSIMRYFAIQFYLHCFRKILIQDGFTGTTVLNKLFPLNFQKDNELTSTCHIDEHCRRLRLHCPLHQQKYPSAVPGL